MSINRCRIPHIRIFIWNCVSVLLFELPVFGLLMSHLRLYESVCSRKESWAETLLGEVGVFF